MFVRRAGAGEDLGAHLQPDGKHAGSDLVLDLLVLDLHLVEDRDVVHPLTNRALVEIIFDAAAALILGSHEPLDRVDRLRPGGDGYRDCGGRCCGWGRGSDTWYWGSVSVLLELLPRL